MTLPLGQRTLRERSARHSLREWALESKGFRHRFCEKPLTVRAWACGRTVTSALQWQEIEMPPRRRMPASVLVDGYLRHRDRRVREVAGVPRCADDLVDDVHALRDLAEQRVVLRKPAGKIVRADEELAAVGVRAGVRHRKRATAVIAVDGLVLELVAGPARPHARRIERRLLPVLPVPGLDDEARDDPMEDHVVIETLVRQIYEVLAGLRCGLREQVDLDVTELGGDGGAGHGVLLVMVPSSVLRSAWSSAWGAARRRRSPGSSRQGRSGAPR